MKTEHIDGSDEHKIMLYALSTCGWCRKTRDLLAELGVAYDFAYLDILPKDEQNDALRELGQYNQSGNFPTVVIDGDKVIIGFREQELREALK